MICDIVILMAQERVADEKARAHWLEKAGPGWQKLTDPELASLIIEDIRAVKEGGLVRLACRRAEESVYGDSFVEAVREVVGRRHARFHVITGPVLIKDKRPRNAIWESRNILFLQ